MKIWNSTFEPRSRWLGAAIATVLASGSLVVAAPPPIVQPAVLTTEKSRGGEGEVYGGSAGQRPRVEIESVERTREKGVAKEVAWLGVFTEEVSEPLGYQLSLKSGEGLLVSYVAPDSPAAKAGLQKFDVLVELGDQLLVHPYQLAKLIRTHKEGDVVKFSLFRRSKKETASATLSKRMEEVNPWPELDLEGKSDPAESFKRAVAQPIQPIKALHETFMLTDANREKYKLELERSMEEARKAIHDALRGNNARAGVNWGANAKEMEALVQSGLALGNDATVILKKDGSSAKTIVKADEAGTCIIIANPKRHLTAHDKDGKLVFDGEIEDEAQQKKVPAELWEKIKPMLQQLGPTEGGEQKPHAETARDPKC